MQHGLSEDEIDALGAGAHGFVGADLVALCNAAALCALRRCVRAAPDSPASAADLRVHLLRI